MGEELVRQALQGVPRSRIQVELGFNLPDYQICLEFKTEPRHANTLGGDTAQKNKYSLFLH